MARAIWLLLLCACAPAEPLSEAARLLAIPAGGRVISAAAPARRLERVETRVCYTGRAGVDVGAELSATLASAGWTDVSVRAHEAIAGRWNVAAAREGLALTGVIDDREEQADCAGAQLRLGAHATIPGADRRTAGPGIRARISP